VVGGNNLDRLAEHPAAEINEGELGSGYGPWSAEITATAVITQDSDANYVIADLGPDWRGKQQSRYERAEERQNPHRAMERMSPDLRVLLLADHLTSHVHAVDTFFIPYNMRLRRRVKLR
jgi:hypothetical protein